MFSRNKIVSIEIDFALGSRPLPFANAAVYRIS
jgi:hypothetical protein